MWLIPPSMSSRCARESVASVSASSSLCQELKMCAWWRGKPLRALAWSRAWRRAGFTKLLSGWVILQPSMRNRGVDEFIASLAPIHANQIPWPENVSAQTMTVFLSIKSSASLMNAGLLISGERTFRGTPADSLRPLSRHWSDWATALRQEYSARQKPETPCGASGCSSWPSARTSDTNGAGQHGDGGLDLRTAATQWPSPMAGSPGTENYSAAGNSDFSRKAMALVDLWTTPQTHDISPRGTGNRNNPKAGNACLAWDAMQRKAPRSSDGEKGGPDQRGSKGDAMLPSQAVQASKNLTWPAPAARDHKGSSASSLIRQDGKSRADMLDHAAEQFFDPPSSPDPATVAGGRICLSAAPNSDLPSVRRKLNPFFVEALMRWPTGLSGFERVETGLIQSPPHGPSSASPKSCAPIDRFAQWQAVQSAWLAALIASMQDRRGQMGLW